jgi:uncharacterized cupredoxin-like copper-binding protein
MKSLFNETQLIALAVLVCGLAACGGATAQPGTGTTAKPAAGANTVTLNEWSVTAPAQVQPGTYSYTITNNSGKTTHELLVFRSDLEPAAYPMTGGNIAEDGAGIAKISDGEDIAPGQSQQRTIDLTQPGKYLFVCNLPAHFGQGMHTVVTVAS